MQTPEYATSALGATGGTLVGNPVELGVIRLNWRAADPTQLAALKTAMHADTWGRIPRTYIRLTKDTSMPLALQDRFITEADVQNPNNPFKVHSLDSSHVGFLVHPREAATLLSD